MRLSVSQSITFFLSPEDKHLRVFVKGSGGYDDVDKEIDEREANFPPCE